MNAEVQMEYEYTSNDPYTERLKKWYEATLGYVCKMGHPRGGGTQFRKCRRLFEDKEKLLGRLQRLEQVPVGESLEGAKKK